MQLCLYGLVWHLLVHSLFAFLQLQREFFLQGPVHLHNPNPCPPLTDALRMHCLSPIVFIVFQFWTAAVRCTRARVACGIACTLYLAYRHCKTPSLVTNL